jgi:hypothetical protein
VRSATFTAALTLTLVTAIAANAQSLFVERVLSNSHSLGRPDPFFSYWVGYARIDPRRDEASTMTSKIRNLLIERYGDHNLSASQVYYVGHRLGLEEKTIHDVVGNEPWLGPIADDLAKRNHSEVDADFEKAAHLAAMVAPYRHARLSTMKLAGDPNNPVHFKDDATAEELRAEIERRLNILQKAGILELKVIEAPELQ